MHKTVLLEEAVSALNIKEDGIYVDATLGFGGHSGLILKKIKRGFLFAFDQDKMAIDYSQKKLKEIGDNFEIIKSNFAYLQEELEKRNIKKVDGFVFDIGVSSPQLDVADRGFSYHNDSKLDMRMDTSRDLSAYNVVNEYSYQDLVRILRNYGEEKYSTSIAKNIIKARETKNIETTLELVDIIKNSIPEKAKKGSHPARKTFQAIRIEVNHELDILNSSLKDALSMLKPKGRMCVITFHSLEDRIVKDLFKEYTEIDEKVKGLPEIPVEFRKDYVLVNRKPIVPSEEELVHNNRARSAKLRIIERIK